jgi:hypothetical protein
MTISTEITEDKLAEAKEDLRVKIEVVKDFNKKNPKDAQVMMWQKEFIEAEQINVKKQIDDRLARLSKSFYDTDYQSIEEDINDDSRDDYIPLAVYSKKPVTIKPYSYTALQKNVATKLNDKQKAFCEFMRNRVIVILSHYATAHDLELRKVSPLVFTCNVLPDISAMEKWILPSHVPISIPLYILRHFGCMTTNKKIPSVSMIERDPEEVAMDSQLKSEGFTFQQLMQVTGTDSYVRFVRLSTVKKQFKKINQIAG